MSSLRLSSSINSTNIISLITTSALSFYAGYRCYHILIKKNNNNEKNENISNYSTSSSSSTTVELNYTTTETIPLMNSVGKIKSPNPNWKIGEIQNMEEKVYESILADDLLKTQGALYNLMISTIIPRPIALVTSKNLKGEINCAPFSFFNMVSYDPPLIVLGMCLSAKNTERIKKDSLVNVEEMKEFVVNIMSSKYIESGNHTCGNFPSDVNEMERSGLTSLDSHLISSPRVAQADIQFECELYKLEPIYNNNNEHTTTVVYGKIKKFHINQNVLVDGSIEKGRPIVNWEKLGIVGRLGGSSYSVVNNSFDIARPSDDLCK